MKSTAIYTAIIGHRDTLLELDNPAWLRTADYICFTDSPFIRSETWQIVRVREWPQATNPRRASRHPKILSHLWLPGYAQTVWLDADSTPKKDLSLEFRRWRKREIAVARHWRLCVYSEVNANSIRTYDPAPRTLRFRKMLEKRRFPRGRGLWRGTLIFRRHTDRVCKFNELWWKLFDDMNRDQPPLNVALYDSRIPYWDYSRPSLHTMLRERPRHLGNRDIRYRNKLAAHYYDNLCRYPGATFEADQFNL